MSYVFSDRLDDADAAVQALCRLGPDAAVVLPSLDALIETGSAPRRVLDDRTWQLMLARLGKPVEDLVKPANVSGTQEDFEARLRSSLSRFRPDHCR